MEISELNPDSERVSKVALSAASIAAEKDGFVSQRPAPPVLIASALAALEGAQPGLVGLTLANSKVAP
jgi:hypothetical protein